MVFHDAALPALSESCIPPIVRGSGFLTTFAYQGADYVTFLEQVERFGSSNAPAVKATAAAYDTSIALQLLSRRLQGLELQEAALADSQIYRIGDNAGHSRPLRLLALVAPGDLMANTPIDFLTNHLSVQLDLLYILPDRPLPPVIPDHDVALFAVGIADRPTLARLRRLHTAWPRPVLNDPAFLPALERDTLSRSLAGIPGLLSPAAVAVTRTALREHLDSAAPLDNIRQDPYPCLIRPVGSHAGAALSRLSCSADLSDYLHSVSDEHFFITDFVDYSSPDGLYRKFRVAFIDRQPFLCHLAISSKWMVHYLNAGMTESAEKREEEARAMADFDQSFGRRHAAAFNALHERLGFDYYSIDCAETQDGSLLLFEADAAAIIHMMDPPDLFPYKMQQMRRVFAAFDDLLHRRAALRLDPPAALCA